MPRSPRSATSTYATLTHASPCPRTAPSDDGDNNCSMGIACCFRHCKNLHPEDPHGRSKNDPRAWIVAAEVAPAELCGAYDDFAFHYGDMHSRRDADGVRAGVYKHRDHSLQRLERTVRYSEVAFFAKRTVGIIALRRRLLENKEELTRDLRAVLLDRETVSLTVRMLECGKEFDLEPPRVRAASLDGEQEKEEPDLGATLETAWEAVSHPFVPYGRWCVCKGRSEVGECSKCLARVEGLMRTLA